MKTKNQTKSETHTVRFQSVEMERHSDHTHSVRFNALPGSNLPVMNSAYVNRTVPGVNQASRIRVTVEVLS